MEAFDRLILAGKVRAIARQQPARVAHRRSEYR
jgi:hypothetical protein